MLRTSLTAAVLAGALVDEPVARACSMAEGEWSLHAADDASSLQLTVRLRQSVLGLPVDGGMVKASTTLGAQLASETVEFSDDRKKEIDAATMLQAAARGSMARRHSSTWLPQVGSTPATTLGFW